MIVKDYKNVLEDVFLNDHPMSYGLYQYELEEQLDDFKESMQHDGDELFYAITTHRNDITGKEDVAMVLIELSGAIHINEKARAKLQEFWQAAYISNMTKLIPTHAETLHDGHLAAIGLKTLLSV